jgi:iron complex transport system substrate-binding protein
VNAVHEVLVSPRQAPAGPARRARPPTWPWLWALLALTALLWPGTTAWAAPAGRIAVIDLAGRQVLAPKNPTRIVCLGPGCLRLIVYLQAQDKLAGIEGLEKRFPRGRPYYLAHPELGRLPVITPGGVAGINQKPDMEKVLKVRPQVIFATYLERRVADEIQSVLGVPVVVLAYGELGSFEPAKVAASLRLAGRILDRRQRAEQVLAFLESNLADLRQRASGAGPSPSVFVGGLGFKGAQGLGSTNAGYLPFTWLGLDNVAASLGRRGRAMMAKERLLALDPEVIFIDGGGLALVAADHAARPGFYRALSAFKCGRVHLLHPYNWYATNLGIALADAYAIGKVTHPAGFSDVETALKTDEIYSFLVGQPVHGQMVEQYGELGGRPTFLGEKKP